jgi:hypothetical protein
MYYWNNRGIKMKAYLDFGNIMTAFLSRDMRKRNLTSPPIEGKMIINHYQKSHLFEIDQTTKKLLVMTKTPECKISDKMPFPRMFIDVEFTRKELNNLGVDVDKSIIGIMVINQYLTWDDRYEIINEDVFLTPEEMQTKSHAVMFYTFFSNEDGPEKTFIPNIFAIPITELDWMNLPEPRTKEERFLVLFFTNLLHLINDPQVKTVIVERDEYQNRKRAWRNKLPIPERNVIKLTGTLRDYVNKLDSDKSHRTQSYRYFVRGHFRLLKNQRYGKHIGSRIWIPPYQRGHGLLIIKKYEIKYEKE